MAAPSYVRLVAAKLFVVERYLPGITADELHASAERLAAAAATLTATGREIRYLGSTFVPEEESCFCRFEASSAHVVATACHDAQFEYARIHEAKAVTNG